MMLHAVTWAVVPEAHRRLPSIGPMLPNLLPNRGTRVIII